MRVLLLALALLAPAFLPGCSEGDGYTGSVGDDGVREVEIHVGWAKDHQTQYMRPDEIHVKQGDKVRFVVFNDDEANVDYNGDKAGFDNFHMVAFDYDTDGDGAKEQIEHEVLAGRSATTDHRGNDYFVAATPGTFRLTCEVRTSPSHDALGMHADLVVA